MCKHVVGQLVSVKILVWVSGATRMSEFTGKILTVGHKNSYNDYCTYMVEPVKITNDSAGFFKAYLAAISISDHEIVMEEPSSLLLDLL